MFTKPPLYPEIKAKEIVSCLECKCLIYKVDATEIIHLDRDCSSLDYETKVYYCNSHKVNYETVYKNNNIIQYYKKIEVDKNGDPVGYNKIDEKNTTTKTK